MFAKHCLPLQLQPISSLASLAIVELIMSESPPPPPFVPFHINDHNSLPVHPASRSLSVMCLVLLVISYFDVTSHPSCSPPPLSQRTCPNCTTNLIFPIHVQNVQCGRCGFNTVFPPVQRRGARETSNRLLTCVNCRTTISFPADAPAVKFVHLLLCTQFSFFCSFATAFTNDSPLPLHPSGVACATMSQG